MGEEQHHKQAVAQRRSRGPESIDGENRALVELIRGA